MINKLRALKNLLFKKSVPAMEQQITYDEKREVIDKYRKKFNCTTLVETGTFLGDTIWFFKEKFQLLYSVELSSELASRAVERFASFPHVEIREGNSADLLEQLLPALNQPSLFWLDGHYSSEFFHNGEYFVTAKGELNTPIERELDAIFNSEYNHIILIDDARLFTGENDYPSLAAIETKVKASGKTYNIIIESDIIQLIPKA